MCGAETFCRIAIYCGPLRTSTAGDPFSLIGYKTLCTKNQPTIAKNEGFCLHLNENYLKLNDFILTKVVVYLCYLYLIRKP